MEIRPARRDDLSPLAHLLWCHAAGEEQAAQPVDAFAVDLKGWWEDHRDTHHAFVASDGDGRLLGMAWLALLPRVPRPGNVARVSADVQSLYVVPEHRGQGIGAALVRAVVEQARSLGARRVTVGSGRRATPLYERLGFASSRQLLERTAE